MSPLVSGECAAYAAVKVVLAFLSLALFAALVAVWQRWVIGSALLAAAGDVASCYAHIRDIDASNRLLDQAAVAACAKEAMTRGSLTSNSACVYFDANRGSDVTGDGSYEKPFATLVGAQGGRSALESKLRDDGDEK
jgi:hypothetical protein